MSPQSTSTASDVTVMRGDCRVEIARLPAASIDVVIADPPYGDTSCDWDSQVEGRLEHLPRVLKPSGSLWCFGSLCFFLRRAADFHQWQYAEDVIWEKHNGSNMAADRFRRVHELLAHFYPCGRHWADIYKRPVFSQDAVACTVRRKRRSQHWGEIGAGHYVLEDGGPRLLRSVLYCRSEHGRAAYETQRPPHLLVSIIEYSSPPGGPILDPRAGAGSTAVAARTLGRRALLIGVRAAACAQIRERLGQDAPLLAGEVLRRGA